MKTDSKILVWTDTNKAGELDRNVEATQQGANDLIHIFESFQTYKKITSLDDFESLVRDPLAMFDEALQTNVSFQESGGKKGNPEIIAKLFDIDRTSYQSIISGVKIMEGTCKPCAKLKIKQTGKGVINYSSYKQYSSYMAWTDNNRFEINEDLVSEKKESFSYYATTPAQIDCYNFWVNATLTLNKLANRGLLGEPNAFSKLLNDRITYSYQAGKFSVDERSLMNEIQSLKN